VSNLKIRLTAWHLATKLGNENAKKTIMDSSEAIKFARVCTSYKIIRRHRKVPEEFDCAELERYVRNPKLKPPVWADDYFTLTHHLHAMALQQLIGTTEHLLLKVNYTKIKDKNINNLIVINIFL
jgi:hypothetical protein